MADPAVRVLRKQIDTEEKAREVKTAAAFKGETFLSRRNRRVGG